MFSPTLKLAHGKIVDSPGMRPKYSKKYKVHCSKRCYPFVSFNAKFGICTVVCLMGQLVKAKIRTFKCPKFVLL
jgi:hypothetical protein